MKLLLDTHIIIWTLLDSPQLSSGARGLILDPANTVFYSIASMWELAVKNFKSPEKCPYDEKTVSQLCDRSGFHSIDIRMPHIIGIRDLCVHSGLQPSNFDPFDRLLISQAKSENMLLLSHDTNFSNYDEPCIIRV